MKKIKEKFGTIMMSVALISVIGFFMYTNMTYKEFKRIYEEKIDNIELAAKIYAEENLNFFENKVYRITTRKLVNAGYKPNEVECTITKNCGDYDELMDKEIIIEETEEGKIEVRLDTEKPIVTLTYEYNGKVFLASNEEIESISGWTRVDGMHYEKEYVEATDETIIVRDKSKNETEVKIEKAKFKIDRESPVCWNNGKEVEEGKSKELIYGCRDNLSGCKEEEKGRISSTQGEVVIPRYVIEDKAGNKTVCEAKLISFGPKIEEPIQEPVGANIVARGSSDSLIFSIEKVQSSKFKYHLTRLWVKNPYEQLNKVDSPNYGKSLYKPLNLLQTTTMYNNKFAVAFNASGFLLKDTYQAVAVNKWPAYDRTSEGTVLITNGVVIRNFYDKTFRQLYVYAINRDNQLVIFDDRPVSSSYTITEKKAWTDYLISSGIRNTLTFVSPLVENGQASPYRDFADPDNKRQRQVLCQLNNNNFILLSSFSNDGGQTRSDLVQIMLDLKCKTAVNLDGGGSVALLYKTNVNSNWITIGGGSRQLPEVALFYQK